MLAFELGIVASKRSREQQVEVPVCRPREEIPGGALSEPRLPVEVLGQEEQTCVCLPRARRQRRWTLIQSPTASAPVLGVAT